MPEEIGSLTSLLHLDIENTGVEKMPPKMWKMKGLQKLSDFRLGKGTASNMKDLGELQQLAGYLAISGLENFVHDGDASGDYLVNDL